MVDPQASPANECADIPEPPALRRLRWLVTALIVVMIVGVVTIVGVLVLRITRPATTTVPLAPIVTDTIDLPEGESITATGGGAGTVSVATRDRDGVERLRIFDAATGMMTAVIVIKRTQE